MIKKVELVALYQVVVEGDWSALDMVRLILIKSLSKAEYDAYDFIIDREQVTVKMLVERFGWSKKHASNVLKALRTYGLVSAGWSNDGMFVHDVYLGEEEEQ